MFTGIIEEIGTIRHVRTGKNSCVLTITANKILSDLKIGDSVAVNGTCLTVCQF
ncbi:MAG: riboflavin synthase, partial [Oscillospiraceae bacterium]|nr:riboflavin synthase [Oscillospiraceae bacterium]